MKRSMLICVILLCSLFVNNSSACPICGCGVGGFYIGLLPTYKSKFIGLRYQYAHYTTRLANEPDEFSNDHYHQVELYGGVTLGKRWQLLGFVPYHINHQLTDEGTIKKNGLGDISLLANYKVWQSSKITKNNKSFTQEFWLGAGLKLPTGRYAVNFADSTEEELAELLGDVNSQMGTGSTDFIFNMMYNIHVGKFGVNTTANYKANTTNNSDFKYGNRLAVNSFAYYEAKAGKRIFMAPNIGVLCEHATANHLTKNKVEETGGYATLASAGLDVNFSNFTVGTNVQLPFAQNYAHGQTNAKLRGLVHLTYTF